MLDLTIPFKILLSLVIGAVIGLERESIDYLDKRDQKHAQGHLLGVRTFSLITTLGALAGFLTESTPYLFTILTLGFIVLTIAYYILNSFRTKDIGITTEIAMIFAYLIGVLIALETFPIQVTIALSVVLILILSRKQTIKSIILDIERSEINAFISYALIALVILPFLPNVSYSLSDIESLESFLTSVGINVKRIAQIEILNPFNLWLIVALITGVDMGGYILEQVIGAKKGRLLASITGGFISSTATTQSLAQESRTSKRIDSLVSYAVFANFASFFPLIILVASINSSFLPSALPTLLLMLISSLAIGLFYLRRQKPENKRESVQEAQTEIFSLPPALKFALLFTLIKVTTQIALAFFGQSGFIITSALAALTGTDAATINISQLAGASISNYTGVISLIMVNAVNLGAKSLYSFLQGERHFAVKFLISSIVISASSLLGVLFV